MRSHIKNLLNQNRISGILVMKNFMISFHFIQVFIFLKYYLN